MRMAAAVGALGLAGMLFSGCTGNLGDAPEYTGDAEEELSSGVNGTACILSPYNCKLRAQGGARVTTANPNDDSWGVATGVAIRDGNGSALATSGSTRLTFNYGQLRSLAGKPHAFALSTSNGSAGWFPIDAISGKSSFAGKVGSVHAHDPHQGKLACYQIASAHDPVLELKKVNYDTTAAHERAGDYLPLVRQNGKRSANLTFNVPGHALGGVAIDHFPAGTKFQRVQLPTSSGQPSIDVPLWVKDAEGRYRKPGGELKFVYGYIVSAANDKRFGWMAYPALEKSSGCP